MEIEPLSVEVTFRGDAADAIDHAAELLGLPYDRRSSSSPSAPPNR